MTRTAEEIVHIHSERVKYYAPMHAAMQEVRSIYDGRAEINLPDFDKNVRSSVPNLLAQGVDQMAGRISSIVPQVTFAAEHPGVRPSERKADTAKRVLNAWWQADRTNPKQLQRARHLIAYGMAPCVLQYDHKAKRPTRIVRDPLQAFPSPEVTTGQAMPADMIFAYTRSIGWLRANGYSDQVQRVISRSAGMSWVPEDTMMTLLEYYDEDCTALLLTSKTTTPDQPTLIWVPPTYSGGDTRVEVLEYTPHPRPVMTVSVPSRITLGGPAGQFDSMIGMYFHQVKLMALLMIATEKSIFPDEYLISRPNEQARFLEGPFDGRSGDVNVIAGGDFKQATNNPGQMAQPLIDHIERAARTTGGIPSEFGGESGSNVRTGRRGDQILSAIIDFPVAEAQEVFAYALQDENRAMIELSKMWDGDQPRTMYVSAGNEMRAVTYKATEVFTHSDHVVSFPASGTDLNSLMIGIGQRLGMGTMSKRSGAFLDPLIANPDHEHDLIVAEGLEEALMAGLQQKVSSGELPPVAVAQIISLVSEDKMTLADAITKVTTDAAAHAAAGTPGQPPPGPDGQPAPPDAGQLAAPATQAGMTGAPPGPPGLNSPKDLATMLTELRKPVRTVVPMANAAQGGV